MLHFQNSVAKVILGQERIEVVKAFSSDEMWVSPLDNRLCLRLRVELWNFLRRETFQPIEVSQSCMHALPRHVNSVKSFAYTELAYRTEKVRICLQHRKFFKNSKIILDFLQILPIEVVQLFSYPPRNYRVLNVNYFRCQYIANRTWISFDSTGQLVPV